MFVALFSGSFGCAEGDGLKVLFFFVGNFLF